jgi:hypothetical protein
MLALGIDIGTSGVRAVAVDAAGAVQGRPHQHRPALADSAFRIFIRTGYTTTLARCVCWVEVPFRSPCSFSLAPGRTE